MSKSPIRLIPAIAAVGAVLPACTDPLVGEWEVTRYKSKVLPIVKTDSDAIYTYAMKLKFEEDGDAELIKSKTITGAKTGNYAYSYFGSWQAESRGDYRISLDDLTSATLRCVISASELECDSPDGRFIEAEPAEQD